MSDVIVTQSQNQELARTTVSAFSRYAIIYGLKSDTWRDGQYCGIRPNEIEQSHYWQGNWFCV